jgi:hypothetical protein
MASLIYLYVRTTRWSAVESSDACRSTVCLASRKLATFAHRQRSSNVRCNAGRRPPHTPTVGVSLPVGVLCVAPLVMPLRVKQMGSQHHENVGESQPVRISHPIIASRTAVAAGWLAGALTSSASRLRRCSAPPAAWSRRRICCACDSTTLSSSATCGCLCELRRVNIGQSQSSVIMISLMVQRLAMVSGATCMMP